MGKDVIRGVVFDLGGVLIQLDHARLGLDVDRDTWHRWLLEHPVARAWETGRCGYVEFAGAVLVAFGVGLDAQELAVKLQDWVLTPGPEAPALVAALRPEVLALCLSNNNPLHWGRLGKLGVGDWFSETVLSFQAGVAKPDPEIYRALESKAGLGGEALLLLDDNLMNVHAARALGWEAEQVVGIQQARAVLAERSLLLG
ncbi:MAG: HAD superfamily hydrolase (TIGR01509 family) [Cognaticolwellia sp.]